jgi:DNA-binding CsgD family transcriptional regulator
MNVTASLRTNPLPRLSRLLLDLHRGSGDVDAAAFQQWALERLREDIAFDSAMWASGAGTEQGPLFHAIHLQHQPMQMLIDYEPLKQHDQLFAQALAEAGKSLRATSATDLPALFQPYCQRYGLAQALCTMTLDAQTALITGVSLYRSETGVAFSDDEAAFMEAVFPHLNACDSRSKLTRLQREAGVPTLGSGGHAACDEKGLLRYADEAFVQALRREWPQWRGPWLPEALHALIESSRDGAAVGRASHARSVPLGSLWLLHLRERRPADGLPKRLRQVAELAVQGRNHKQIAALLGLAPATVRNQLADLYKRLGVTNRAALAASMQGREPPTP